MTTYRTEIRVSGGFYTIRAIFHDDRLALEYHSSYMGTEPKDFLVDSSYENLSSYHGWMRILSIKNKENRELYSWEKDEFRSEGGFGIVFEYFIFPEPQIHLINDVVMEQMRSMGSVSHNPTFSLLVMGFGSYDETHAEYRELLNALEIGKLSKVDD
jgi:hypothetical protein